MVAAVRQPPLLDVGDPPPLAAPIVKWAGGKAKLASTILRYVPKNIATYAEPFAGGAATFFALRNEELRGKRVVGRYVLSDTNFDLVTCYRAVRDDVEGVIERLRLYTATKDEFLRARAADVSVYTRAERAARFLFLNRTAFNGLWRVNRAGDFNVPWGKYKNPTICNAAALRAASRALRGVVIDHAPFAVTLSALKPGDFVYLDPPYLGAQAPRGTPKPKGKAFTSYTQRGFTPADHEELAHWLVRLAHRNVCAILSNAATREARALYKDRPVIVRSITVRRSVGAKTRQPARELLVRNWRPERMLKEKGA